jgi:hypothetical protein
MHSRPRLNFAANYFDLKICRDRQDDLLRFTRDTKVRPPPTSASAERGRSAENFRQAAEHQATLLSLDQRATATYETVGATVEQLLA